ncbi:MAG: Asp23/Gls24 family envelope stress response protein [Lachnospiraceae bacterium]|nr:Asp23/Gls24 family envelope stress response protein [Lachnospiraceae bacterium]
MAEDRKVIKIDEGELGVIQIADEVVAIIAGLAATEVEGVSSMAGNITNELVAKLGMKNLAKGVKVELLDNSVVIVVAINVAFGTSVPEVSRKVQEKIISAVETMTGLTVAEVNVKIAGIDMEKES